MPLPIVESTKYETKLPSTGKKIQYRPYLVKEEKILMIALESGDQKQIMQAVKDTIAACTFNKLNPNDLPIFDLEYVFLRLRAKSVGEISKLNLKCEKCTKNNTVEINLEEIQVNTENLPSSKIKLNDKIGVVMTWPKVDLIADISEENNKNKSKLAFDIITGCIESIYDSTKVYPASEQTKEELDQFVESLNQDQFLKIQNFVQSMPKLQHDINFDCVHCKESNSILVKGLQNFFSSPSPTIVS